MEEAWLILLTFALLSLLLLLIACLFRDIQLSKIRNCHYFAKTRFLDFCRFNSNGYVCHEEDCNDERHANDERVYILGTTSGRDIHCVNEATLQLQQPHRPPIQIIRTVASPENECQTMEFEAIREAPAMQSAKQSSQPRQFANVTKCSAETKSVAAAVALPPPPSNSRKQRRRSEDHSASPSPLVSPDPSAGSPGGGGGLSVSPALLEIHRTSITSTGSDISDDLIIDPKDRRSSVSSEDNFSDFEESHPANGRLQRAMSSESVDSSCSAFELLSLESFAGQLEVRLFYDKSAKTLNVWIVQAYELKSANAELDPEVWIVLFLLPHNKPLWRTQLVKGAINPQFHELFTQRIREHTVKKFALLCQVYSRFSGDQENKVSLVGQAKVRLKDVELSEPNTLSLNVVPNCSDTANDVSYGQLLFSLQYIPMTERLSVILCRIKDVRRPDGSLPTNIFIKAYLVQSARRIAKKKTATKLLTDDGCAMINESMIFSLSQTYLQKVYLRLSVIEVCSSTSEHLTIGQVTIGSRCADKGFGHWNQMCRSFNKAIPMWHTILPRKPS